MPSFMKENVLELGTEKWAEFHQAQVKGTVTKATEARNKVQIQSWEVTQGRRSTKKLESNGS